MNNVIFSFSGKQLEYIPKKRTTFRVSYQKIYKPGDTIEIDRILSDGNNFGRPYLKDIRLLAEVVKHGLKKKITIFKYKAKKRSKTKQGFRERYTEIKIVNKKNVDKANG